VAPVATAPAAPAAPAAGPADGETIYKTYCLPCHGADGKGNNGLAANYVDDKTRLAQPDEVLIASIKNGKTGTVGTMPPWGGTLSDAQITAVLGYVRTSFGAPK
jgi:mono/diheme cytochrome c family protein